MVDTIQSREKLLLKTDVYDLRDIILMIVKAGEPDVPIEDGMLASGAYVTVSRAKDDRATSRGGYVCLIRVNAVPVNRENTEE